MSHWNYRLIMFKDDIEICEVYYEKGKPIAYTPNITILLSLYYSSLFKIPKEMRKILKLMKKATRKPILNYKIFKKEKYCE